MKALGEIIARLQPIAREIRVVKVPAGRPQGWDAADTDAFEIHQLVSEAEIHSGEIPASADTASRTEQNEIPDGVIPIPAGGFHTRPPAT